MSVVDLLLGVILTRIRVIDAFISLNEVSKLLFNVKEEFQLLHQKKDSVRKWLPIC